MSNNMKKEYISPAVIKTVIASKSTILAGSIGISSTEHSNDDALGKGNNGDDNWDDDEWDDAEGSCPQVDLWE